MKHNTTNAAKAFIEAKKAVEAAEKAKAEAEAILSEAFARSGITSITVDGSKVTLVTTTRPSYDVEMLADMVSPATLKKVTKLAVDGKKMKAAIEVGTIKPDIAEAVTTYSVSQSIRITAGIAGEADEKVTKVA